MKLYYTNQTIDRKIAREKELRIEEQTGLTLENPFYDGKAKEVRELDATGSSNLTPEEIVATDLKKIMEADGLVAYMSNDKDIGSCMEIVIAKLMYRLPVYVIAPNDNAYFHPWMRFFATEVFRTEYQFIKFAQENFKCVQEYVQDRKKSAKRKDKKIWKLLEKWMN